ncbi:dnaJ homolog subfamily C member 4-like [Ricinus communis]|uniref:dnaJ homolog subfamily C member 4-like n=1 Tax=Ricinus communis TaxID=3988 RepID=UPI00201AAE37|nr:dnaJ homolog subfamily C member 4-like [Ricinus communis]
MAVLMNHYSVLGLASFAGFDLTEEEISKAFKRMALRLHPDKHPGNLQAHFKFQKLLSSCDILENPISRKEFDRLLQFQYQHQNHHHTCNKQQREDQQQHSSEKRPRQPMGPKVPSESTKKPSFVKTKFCLVLIMYASSSNATSTVLI